MQQFPVPIPVNTPLRLLLSTHFYDWLSKSNKSESESRIPGKLRHCGQRQWTGPDGWDPGRSSFRVMVPLTRKRLTMACHSEEMDLRSDWFWCFGPLFQQSLGRGAWVIVCVRWWKPFVKRKCFTMLRAASKREKCGRNVRNGKEMSSVLFMRQRTGLTPTLLSGLTSDMCTLDIFFLFYNWQKDKKHNFADRHFWSYIPKFIFCSL